MKRFWAVLLILGISVFITVSLSLKTVSLWLNAFHFRSVPPGVPPVALSLQSADPSRAETFAQDDPVLRTPTLDQVRNEASRDPHVTPPALLEFATRVGRRMDLARKDPQVAQDLYQEMENCARREGPQTIRVFCLSDARELAGFYPDRLEKRFDELRGALPQAIVQMENEF